MSALHSSRRLRIYFANSVDRDMAGNEHHLELMTEENRTWYDT